MSHLFPHLSRRHFLRAGAASAAISVSGWLAPLARLTANDAKRKRSCILLWMNGGPSTIDLWDLKPGHENGGKFKEIATKVPGMKIGEHLPEMAKWADRLSLVRTLNSREGDHSRATYVMRTGNSPMGAIHYPSIGGLLSKELGDPKSELPQFVSVAPQRLFNPEAYGAGYLGPTYDPLIVGEVGFNRVEQSKLEDILKVKNLERDPGTSAQVAATRTGLLQQMQSEFAAGTPSSVASSHVSAYERAVRLMNSSAGKAFDLEQEKKELRDQYGRNLFGQGCLLARRLVERGVPFVEVTLDGWDTHTDNFSAVKTHCGNLDRAWSRLMTDLKERGLLDSTLIVWMGEFGRTPRINPQGGRDHFPAAFSAVLAGGGIKGGSITGKTSADGTEIVERPTSIQDFLATTCLALGVDYEKQNLSNVGRPIRIVDKSANPIKQVIA
ncbi:MAG: DUF1501 domain-containing protein [Gemmataceae bacterium]